MFNNSEGLFHVVAINNLFTAYNNEISYQMCIDFSVSGTSLLAILGSIFDQGRAYILCNKRVLFHIDNIGLM